MILFVARTEKLKPEALVKENCIKADVPDPVMPNDVGAMVNGKTVMEGPETASARPRLLVTMRLGENMPVAV